LLQAQNDPVPSGRMYPAPTLTICQRPQKRNQTRKHRKAEEMKIEIILEATSDTPVERVLEYWDELKQKANEMFAVKSAKLIFDKALKEIELSKY